MHSISLQEKTFDYFFCLFEGGKQSYLLNVKNKMEKVGWILRKFRTLYRKKIESRIEH